MARLIARTIVDAGLAAECEVGISYAIGKLIRSRSRWTRSAPASTPTTS
ncbi:S-adenosylmethionine synthetase [Cutibacterium acnes JCM 18918]|nr:S-adenosylmethionine synthetase [Cutibacterium acnes JCM 18918]